MPLTKLATMPCSDTPSLAPMKVNSPGDNLEAPLPIRDAKKLARTKKKELFASSLPSDPSTLLDGLPKALIARMNRWLSHPVTIVEVKHATFSINGNSAPGEDDFTGAFFQAYWDIVGQDIFQACVSFFGSCRLLHDLNHTLLALIPKGRNVQNMSQVCPISLCNCLYKIFSKLLMHRLQHIMPKIISLNQSAFIKGRLISDNILVAHEIMHHLKCKSRTSSQEMALKLDMSKAYDRVEWPFLLFILRKMGFNEQFMVLIHQCILTISSIMSNGAVYDYFKPGHGLHQGDPLSPHMFVLCMEGLSFLLHKACQQQLIHGIKVSRLAPPITSLFFADDIILFGRDSLHAGLLWNIGTSTMFPVLQTHWLPSVPSFSITGPEGNTRAPTLISEFMDRQTGLWIPSKVCSIFPQSLADYIMTIEIRQGRDKPSWPHTPSGTYTVESVYKPLLELE
ncbi:hypothetical protein Cni_G13993 [Canna indica]|uniref:Reverse transcriptase domain-containing protein n=1 Tax=Canna indica TaxID=4628 RepID=A0AAQ3QD84_9LILI|nr:hypothetical protein Cni_G13993 [Canna indica]